MSLHPLIRQVQRLTEEYVRKGGKDSRQQQRSRMLRFAAHAATYGAKDMGQVGAQHVIRYWKSNRDLSDATLKEHWRALKTLWQLCEKPDPPPLPRTKAPTLKDKLFGRGYEGCSPHGDSSS